MDLPERRLPFGAHRLAIVGESRAEHRHVVDASLGARTGRGFGRGRRHQQEGEIDGVGHLGHGAERRQTVDALATGIDDAQRWGRRVRRQRVEQHAGRPGAFTRRTDDGDALRRQHRRQRVHDGPVLGGVGLCTVPCCSSANSIERASASVHCIAAVS